MDSLHIQALSINASIGVYDWEQRIKQQLLLDIMIPADLKQCNDDLSKTVDYDALCQKVTQFVEGQPFLLIETVACQVAELIQTTFSVSKITVAVTKPHAVKNAGVIKVIVERE